MQAVLLLAVSCSTAAAFMPCVGVLEIRFRDLIVKRTSLFSFSQNRWQDLRSQRKFRHISQSAKPYQRTIQAEATVGSIQPAGAGAKLLSLETRENSFDAITIKNSKKKNQDSLLVTKKSIKDPFPSMLQELGRAKLGSGEIQQILVKASAENIKFRCEAKRLQFRISQCTCAAESRND